MCLIKHRQYRDGSDTSEKMTWRWGMGMKTSKTSLLSFVDPDCMLASF